MSSSDSSSGSSLGGRGSLGSSTGSSSGWGGSDGKSRWISQVSLQLLSLGKSDLGLSSDGQQVLESIDNAVGHRCGGWVADGQGDSGDVGNAGHKLGLDVFLS